jgi:hypothetical protein
MSEFRVKWQVDDGYVNNGPHHFTVYNDSLWPGMTDADINNLFWDELKDDFGQTASPSSEQGEEFLEWAKAEIAKMKEEE